MSNNQQTDLFIEAELLNEWIKKDKEDLIIVDICQAQTFLQIHLPKALHIDYNDFVGHAPPVSGLLPKKEQFEHILSTLGWHKNATMVCYDEEGGGMAGRFIWTCHAYGIENVRLLNGGLNYWYKNTMPLSNELFNTTKTDVNLTYSGNNVCNAQYIMNNLDSLKIMDARSLAEYDGSKKYAKRGGKIPGAVHYEWTKIMNQEAFLKTHPFEQLTAEIEALGFNKEDKIIVYCQTHHRSALNYTLLKQLGFNHVKGYEGSWSDWGNRQDTPIE